MQWILGGTGGKTNMEIKLMLMLCSIERCSIKITALVRVWYASVKISKYLHKYLLYIDDSIEEDKTKIGLQYHC